MNIGDPIWYFDINHRVYPEREPGRIWSSGGPIYREHWVKTTVVGETAKSWISEDGLKCPKKGDRRGWALSEAEVNDDCWMSDEKHRIVDALRSVNDVALLQKVAELIGYRATESSPVPSPDNATAK